MPLPRLLSFDLTEEPDSQETQPAIHGYDLLVRIIQATNLPGNDWWSGMSDPYAVARLVAPGVCSGGSVEYRTRTAFRDLNPEFDEFFEVGNVAPGCELQLEVWDKDILTPDDVLGRASWEFQPQQPQQGQQPAPQDQQPDTMQPLRAHFERLQLQQQQAQQQQAQPPATSGSTQLRLQLTGSRGTRLRPMPRQPGQLHLEVRWQPSEGPGDLRMLGPVRFRQQLSPGLGMLMLHFKDDGSMAWSTYKLFLCHIETSFAGAPRCPWNRAYANAAKIYGNPVLLSGVRSQHAALYATHLGRSRYGVLRGAPDFFALFNGGMRGGQRRYFTYSLMADSLRCSETGAGFAADMMSKHAMHSGGAEEVLCAGEFCIVPDAAAPGGHRLVVDNNSGTFAPPASLLPRMRDLLLANWPGMAVEMLAADDPRLEQYHRECPSRLKAAVAAEAVAEAEAAAAAAGPAAASPAGSGGVNGAPAAEEP